MPNRIQKALRNLTQPPVKKASTGSMSSFIPNASPQWGQPNISQVGDVMGLVTPERQREIVMKAPTSSACMNVILDYAIEVDLKLRNRDASKPVPDRQRRVVEEYMRKPNPEHTWKVFAQKYLRDLTVLGYAGAEFERNAQDGVANIWPLDSAKLRIDFDEHGTTKGYNMLNAKGQVIVGRDGVHAWPPEDVVYAQRDAQSNSNYAISRFAQLFACAVLECLMMAFIGNRFTESNIPYGVLDLGDITEAEQKAAITIWNQQMEQLGQNKLMLTGTRGGIKFVPFTDPLDKMHAQELLREVRGQQMAILGVTVNELGDVADVNKSNGFNLSYTFKKRAIEPLLGTFCETLTRRLLWDELGFDDLELYYDEIDSRDELLQSQIDKLNLDLGIWSINQVRNRKGLADIPGGEEPFVIMGTNAVPVSMLHAFAMAQYEAVLAEVEALRVSTMLAQAGGGSDPNAAADLAKTGSPPVIRGPGATERFTTPGGAGSSTPKFKLPGPNLPPGTTPTRGPVQAANRVGARKENLEGKSS